MNYFDIWPQLTIIGYTLYSIGKGAYTFTPEYTVKSPNWLFVIGQFVCFFCGGFIKVSIPCLVFLTLFAFGVGQTYREIGKTRKHTMFSEILGIFAVHFLLYLGDFYTPLLNFHQL